MSEQIKSGLYNYYGEVTAIKYNDGRTVIALDSYDTCREVEISEELFQAFKKEFGEN